MLGTQPVVKIESVLACLIIFGKVDQSLFTRKVIVSIPYVVVCTFGSCESKVHTITYGIETISFLGNRFLSTLPNIIKQASTLSIFKSHIKCWKGENCNCRLCKIYIQQVGYLTW